MVVGLQCSCKLDLQQGRRDCALDPWSWGEQGRAEAALLGGNSKGHQGTPSALHGIGTRAVVSSKQTGEGGGAQVALRQRGGGR